MMRTLGFTHPISQLTEMDRLLDTVLNRTLPPAGLRRGSVLPAINVWEDDQNVLVEAEVPGLAMENIELLIQGDELTIRGQRQPNPQNTGFYRQERWFGKFERTITLPAPVDTQVAEASLHNGVLTITLPKAASARPRKIEIKPVT
jgi:HSP20 family protein